ncbi:alpha-(1-_3)-arabinofuranosyltransferase domain-containing protein [Streptomyces sp. CA-135486]|uniref:alpha-(1->3)-arabinofuranosyltransferase domain-containing protein n=1 Tax=Streptomyces sp. CA-135486 TaxID=3240049 RepID=UPI003D93A721
MAETTLTLPPSRPGRPRPTAPPPPPPAGGPRRRSWLLAFWAAVFVAFLSVSPGRMTFETKLGVVADPWKFIGDLGELWQSRAGFGGLSNQYAGYAFPTLPYYALTDLAHIPVWLAERLWLSLIVATAFWGVLRLAECLDIGSARTRLLGAVGYALWPTFTVVVGSTSAAALPGALLPWVLLPLTGTRTPRVAAATSALLIPFMGGVNAASTLASLLPVGLYLLSRPAGPRKRALIAWWVPGVVLATAWWVVPLLLLGVYGNDFMPYVEQADTTTGTMSATELLRGAGNWVAYLHFGEAWLPAGWTVATAAITILGTAFAAALGLAGLARRDLPERRWLLLTVLAVVLIALAGYGGSLGAPFHDTVRDWLNGALRPFRSVYKFQPGLALALAFGLMHLVATASRSHGARPFPARRHAPLIAALLVLPGLAWPYVNGTILQPGAFKKLPGQWTRAADWLEKNSPDSRALVVPATAHGLYTWGSPIDQPFDVLGDSRWAQRDFVPFGTPGSRRAMDAVEQALMSGSEVPGLRDYLSRAGLYFVVVRNDLDPDQIGYVPPITVKRTLEASGYRRVTGFNPVLTGGRIPSGTPLQVQGIFPRMQAVEIYEPTGTRRPGQVGLQAVADTAVVSGGPEALLQLSADARLRNRPTVLTGDNHPGLGTPAAQYVADGLRRADTRFGLVNSNTSYTYTADERNPTGSLQDPGERPRQILPTNGAGHQTTAVLRGAASVTASSSGNWLFHLPQYDPVNAFDGNPGTAWAEGSAGNAAGQWLRIGFTSPTGIPGSLQLTPLPGDGMRAAPTLVRVETDQGFEDSPLAPNGNPQPVKAPAGQAKWLKITVLAAQSPKAGLGGAGFSEVSVPGVQVTRLLRLPTDAHDNEARAEVFSLHRGSDPGGLSPVSAEEGLHRRFGAGRGGDFAITAQALPVPGEALDRLVTGADPRQGRRITATADSTSRLGNGLSPRNLVDEDLTTAWIAGDRPVIHLRWAGRKTIDEIVLAAAGGLSTRPEQILISTPNGAVTAAVDENGLARFEPITTDRLDITISRAAPLTVHNPVADNPMQLPVGLSEVYVPALADLRTPPPDSRSRFSVPCGEGPPVAVDGTLHATSASGTVRDLTERRPVEVTLCRTPDGTLPLGPGLHQVEAGDAGPLALTDITLTRGEVRPPAASEQREATATDWRGDRRSVTVGAGEAGYLQMYENANAGWKATLNGKKLIPLRIDGWQQAWLIPAGAGGTVELEYEPVLLYDIGMIGGAVAVALLAGLALIRRRDSTPASQAMAPPAPGWVLGCVALTLVVAVVAGPFALIVPALAVVARLRPSLLVPIALVAMAGAGIAAATGAGDPVSAGRGAFGPTAQLLALIALCAAVVTVDRRVRATAGSAAPEPQPLPQRVRSANGPAWRPVPGPAPHAGPPGNAPPHADPPGSPPPHAEPPRNPPLNPREAPPR